MTDDKRIGKVETPCAPCAGFGHIERPAPNDAHSDPCGMCHGSGVETPEAAVEAMAYEIYKWSWTGALRPEYQTVRASMREDAEMYLPLAIKALRAQGWTPPGTEHKQ